MAAVGASAIGFGVLPVLAVWGAEAGLNVMTLLILRFALTAALLRPPFHALGGLSVLGLLFAAQSVLYLAAVARIPAGLAVLLHSVYPVIVLVFSVASRQERLTGRLLVPMVVAMVGLALTVGTPGSTDELGVLYARVRGGLRHVRCLGYATVRRRRTSRRRTCGIERARADREPGRLAAGGGAGWLTGAPRGVLGDEPQPGWLPTWLPLAPSTRLWSGSLVRTARLLSPGKIPCAHRSSARSLHECRTTESLPHGAADSA